MKQTLTNKEEMLMNIFWKHGSLFIRDVISYLPEPRPHYNTVATLVKFLEEKGFLDVSEVVSQYYDNSYTSLVSQFVEEEKIDLDELKALIASIESRKP